MGIPCLILGASGTGKSTSLRNFKKGEIGIFNVANKPLPFRGDLDTFNTSDYEAIKKSLMNNKFNCYAIDDSQYLMAFAMFSRAYEKGYEKFTQFAVDFQQLLNVIINGTSSDTVVYLLHHTDTDENGHIKAKTVGKMLDEKLTVEGLFSVVLMTHTDGESYTFITNGQPPAKTPLEMFADKEIPNDLKAVDDAIRAYWNLPARTAGKKAAK